MRQWICIFCFVVVSILGFVTGAGDVPPEVANGGKKGNPGVKVRVTQKGLDYLNQIAARQMSLLIPRTQLDDVTVNNLGSKVTLTNTRVTGYTPPREHSLTLSPADQIVWSMKGMRVSTTGHFVSTAMLLNEEGDFDADAQDVDLTYSVRLIRQPNGQLGVKTKNCKANVGKLDVNLYNTGLLGQTLQAMKGLTLGFVKPQLSNQLCAQGRQLVDDEANRQLASIPTKIWLNDTDQLTVTDTGNRNTSPTRNSAGRRVTTRRPTTRTPEVADVDVQAISRNITKQLMLDYASLRDPVETKQYVETYHSGEISYRGQGGTPFFPTDFREPTPYPIDRMLYVVATDYTANSLLYQAYKHGLITYRVSAEETPQLASYLKTDCDQEDIFAACLGTIVPEMQEQYPGSSAEIQLAAGDSPPTMLFQRSGQVELNSPLTVTINAKTGTKRQLVLVADLQARVRVNLYPSGGKICGNATFDPLKSKIRTNNLRDFDQKRSESLFDTVRALTQEVTNIYLKNGLPLPIIQGIQLINPKITVFDRTARLDADVQADEDTVSQLTADTVQSHAPGAHLNGFN